MNKNFNEARHTVVAGLCKGRHDIPGVEEYVYPNSVNPLHLGNMFVEATEFMERMELKDGDLLKLYVTGLTVALVTVINKCRFEGVSLILYHYDRDSGTYYPQVVKL